MSYNQITQEERYQTYALLKASNNQTQIAMILNRHKSTTSRVIRRNTSLRGYRLSKHNGWLINANTIKRVRVLAIKYGLLLFT